jgi:hypothetical protein
MTGLVALAFSGPILALRRAATLLAGLAERATALALDGSMSRLLGERHYGKHGSGGMAVRSDTAWAVTATTITPSAASTAAIRFIAGLLGFGCLLVFPLGINHARPQARGIGDAWRHLLGRCARRRCPCRARRSS